MIKKVLTYCADQLNSYLSRYHHRPEGLAEVGHIGQSTNELTTPLLLNLTIEIPKSHKKYDIWGIFTTIFAFLGKFTVSLP